MGFFFNAIKNIGEIIEIDGHNPLNLKMDGFIWFVKEGHVNLFVTKENCDRRHYVKTVEKNDFFIGGEIEVSSYLYKLIGVGVQDTLLLKVPIVNLIENELSYQEFLTLFNDKYKTAHTYIDIGIVEWTHREWMIQHLKVLNQARKKEGSLIEQGIKSDDDLLNASLEKLSKILDDRLPPIEDTSIESSDYLVCKKICEYNKIPIVDYQKLTETYHDLSVENIAYACRFRVRKVKFKDKWWKNDSGPFIGFLSTNKQAVALIPVTPSRYELYDYVSNKKSIVDDSVADLLLRDGLMCYCPLPVKSIGPKTLLEFGIGRCWRRDFLFLIGMALLSGLVSVIVPIATGIIFDSIIPEGNSLQLLQVGLFLVAFTISGVLFDLTKAFAIVRIEGNVDTTLQSATWDRLLSLPAEFFSQFTAGDLAMRSLMVNKVRSILSGVVISSIISGVFSLLNLILMFYYDTSLALIAFTVIAFSLCVSVGLGLKQLTYEGDLVSAENYNAGVLFQLISSVQKFKIAGAEVRAFSQWIDGYRKSRTFRYKKERLANISTTFNEIIETVLLILIFFWMGSGVKSGLAAGQFIAFNAAMLLLLKSMLSLSEAFLKINVIKPMYEKAKPIFESLPEYDESKEDVGRLAGGIEVNHISFKYPNSSEDVLKDVTLKIKAGEYVALVGPSGSGKSTLFRNLIGFEHPYKGRIFYDDKDMEKYDIRSIRRQLGVVLQNGQLMAGELYTNIIGSNIKLTLDDAWKAAKMAGLEEDINAFPMGMHTFINEGGQTLSGGQRQRLMIARAIVNEPKILFFDEATSALDNKTQRIVSQSLESVSVTRVVIAHRLSTIKKCDRIIVMENGKIVETGRYEELLSNKGLFYDLAQRQMA